MRWRMSLMSLVIFLIGLVPLTAMADAQPGQYRLTITASSGASLGDSGNAGPISGLLPQTSELQQWLLLAIGIVGLILLTFLIIIWWRNRQLIKEQP